MKQPVALVGFTSEAAPGPYAPANVTVGRSRWRRPVAGLCAGTGLAVALALIVPGDSQSAQVSSRSNMALAPRAPVPSPGAAVFSERDVPRMLVTPETGGTPRESAAVMAAAPAPGASPTVPPQQAAVVVTPSPIQRDESVIRSVLERYRRAYERLDAKAATMISPSVDERGLSRAFSDLESQSLRFDHCRIDIDSARGVAACQGEATYAARTGDRSIRTQTGTWTFELHKNGDDWTIKWVQQSP